MLLFLQETHSNQNILSKHEVVSGRLLIVRAEIRNFHFLFVNIYAPNIGEDRVQFFFIKLKHFLKQQQDGDVIVLGGDWNCTLDFAF